MKNPIVHFEIPADDVERAIDFYTKTFGWQINKFDMPPNSSTGGDPYYGVITTETDDQHMATKPGTINGGLMKRVNAEHVFSNYIQVDEIEDAIKDITENGGTILMPKTEIAPGMGWIASFKDTEGNFMGLHQMSPEMKAQEK